MSALMHLHFLRPAWLLALLPLALLLWRLWRRSAGTAAWERVCQPNLLRHLLVVSTGRRGRYPLVLLGLAWLAATVALAGPVWSRLPQPVYRSQAARVLVLDLSRSMDATDVPPSRLARARFKLQDILGRKAEEQDALVVFAGEAYVIAPLTDDAATIAAMVPALSTDLMPVHGSRADLGLRKAVELLERAGVQRGDILLITDGLDSPAAALEAVRALRPRYRLSVLAVGTAKGGPIPLAEGGFVKDERGAIVIPRLDEGPLRELAAAGGGAFARLSADDSDLRRVLLTPEGAHEVDKAGRILHTADVWREEGPWLVLALLPLAALGFRRGWLAVALVWVLVSPQPGYALSWDSLWSRPDQQGVRELAGGNPAVAAKTFQDPLWRGTAHYRAGDYKAAIADFSRADTAAAHYNRGNALARAGRLREALQAYQAALAKDPGDKDAAYNRDLVKKLLERRQQQSRQGSQGQQGSKGSRESQGQTGQQGKPGQQAGQEQRGVQTQAGAQGKQNQQAGPGQQGKGRQGSREQQGSQGQTGAQGKQNQQAKQARQGRQGAQSGKQGPQNPQAGEAKPVEGSQAHSAGQGEHKPGRKQSAGTAKQRTGAASSGRRPQGLAKGRDQGREQSPSTAQRSGQLMGQEARSGEAGGTAGGSGLAADKAETESRQAMEQWLRQIPDDPGGLLRRKLMLDHLTRKDRENDAANPW